MAELSNNLLVVAIFAYVAAMMAYGAEWAFSPRTLVSRVASRPRSRELVGAGGPNVVDDASGGEDVEVVTRLSPPGSQDTPGGRSALFGRIAVGLTALGVLAHAGTSVTRALAAGRVPWGNMYEFVLMVTLAGGIAWLVLLTRRPEARPLGLFVTLVMVLLLGTAVLLYAPAGPLQPALNSYWLAIHVSAMSIAAGIFLVGFVSAALHLIRNGYDQGRRSFPFTLGERLPEADRLEKLAFRLTAFSFPIYTFAVICGAIWAEAAWGRYWGWDPKETWSFVAWIAYAGYLHARATPSVKRVTASWIAVAAWTTMMVNLFGVNLVVSGLHSYAGVK